jgi:TPR repeat protein
MSLKNFLSGANAIVGIAGGDLDKVKFHELVKKANAGDADVQYLLGRAYAGLIVDGFDKGYAPAFRTRGKRDMRKAFLYWEMAAAQDHGTAMGWMGCYLLEGHNVNKNVAEGVRLIKRSAAYQSARGLEEFRLGSRSC